MNRMPLVKTLFVVVVTFLFASVTQAQATRTWVSGVGDDVNPCSRTAPCKTFAGAISKTATGGEISVLDPGGFGAVTITKGITINGDGTLAGILNAGVNGVLVNITTNPGTSTVYLRNLSINAAQNATLADGVRVLSGGTVVVENCTIYGQSSDGIEVAAGANTNLKVNNTTIEDITGDCIKMNTTVGQVLATIDNSRLQNCASAVNAVARVRANVSNSVLSHGTNGVITTGLDSQVNIDRTSVSFFTTGLKTNNAGVAGRIRVSDSIIAQNSTALDTSLGGFIDSFQGNSLYGNTVAGAFSSTTLKQ
jgi:hypothetical protein